MPQMIHSLSVDAHLGSALDFQGSVPWCTVEGVCTSSGLLQNRPSVCAVLGRTASTAHSGCTDSHSQEEQVRVPVASCCLQSSLLNTIMSARIQGISRNPQEKQKGSWKYQLT